ncbi:Transglycosylase SLT domain-containing protein [Natronincola peptidivorans]|uniref:Transglycosylase SLT domain-containing protein n=1 Tax=Natronincola peptidivorans TaxID=426128 RepID=A0A1H9Z217_9FIRM|nr:lytic transglycosylase domain-containing protein [Natronincola peptidivorans]SES75518.1 Transglycosylase SLT domain-containing protein [Natronincola peptidivorans]
MMKNIIHQIYFEKITDVQSRIPVPFHTYSKTNMSFLETLDHAALTVQSKNTGSFDKYIQSAAEKYSLSANLIKSIIKIESNFNSRALSRAGAQGIMQLMPATAKELGVVNVWNPQQNIDGGAKYLKQLLDQYDGDLSLALAAYNAGPGNVQRYGGVPPFNETQNYIKNVLNQLKTYETLHKIT